METAKSKSAIERLQWDDQIDPKDIEQLPPDALMVSLLGVNYVHVRTKDEGDLYVTLRALPYLEHLQPENWYEKEWFEAHREKLQGTSTVYAVPTKDVNGTSIRIVVKYNRVGQDVPLETKVIYEVLNAEFNGPFEEFALVEEMRHSTYGPADLTIRSQLPFAIYVPPERMQLWQTGRSEAKIASKIAKHPGVAIDILRDYMVIYLWLEGIDAVQAYEEGLLTEPELRALTARAIDELKAKGYRVLDMKPMHIIVQETGEGELMQKDGRIRYGLVDFELLERTPEHDREVKRSRRSEYLWRQRDRFAPKSTPFPAHLKEVSLLGVHYVHGQVESTGGALWVVGRDPALFDYFLPERWRKTPQIQLQAGHETFYTRTKDQIHLVWKVSRVGERPEIEGNSAEDQAVQAHGFNSPFEEFAIALRLRRAGIPTIYPRAIYRTGHRSQIDAGVADRSRYESHAGLRGLDGKAVLRPGYDYIAVWGYWNGPDEMLANRDAGYFKGVNGAQAKALGILNEEQLRELLDRERLRLKEVGMEFLRLRPEQLLLSLDSAGTPLRDADGHLETRICNFQFIRWPALWKTQA
mgnify:CR=1 FL=1